MKKIMYGVKSPFITSKFELQNGEKEIYICEVDTDKINHLNLYEDVKIIKKEDFYGNELKIDDMEQFLNFVDVVKRHNLKSEKEIFLEDKISFTSSLISNVLMFEEKELAKYFKYVKISNKFNEFNKNYLETKKQLEEYEKIEYDVFHLLI